ncbi:hypothetical protein ACQJBY_072440 [Aegilops geniculata]
METKVSLREKAVVLPCGVQPREARPSNPPDSPAYKLTTLSPHPSSLPKPSPPPSPPPAAATSAQPQPPPPPPPPTGEDEDDPGVGDDGDPGGGDRQGLREDDLRDGAAGHADPQLQAPQPRLPAAGGRAEAKGGRLVRHPQDHGRHPDRHLPRPEPHHRGHQGLPLQDAVRVRPLPHQRLHHRRQPRHRDQELPRREEGEEGGHA